MTYTKSTTSMEELTQTETVAPKDSFLAKAEREEKAARKPIEKEIAHASIIINAAISGLGDDIRSDITGKQNKLAALRVRLEAIPDELAKLAAEGERLQSEIAAVVENDGDLAKLTKAISANRAKIEEVNVLRKALEETVIPKAEDSIKESKAELANTFADTIGAALEEKRLATMEIIEKMNADLQGWCYAVNDACTAIGINLHGRLAHLRFRIDVKHR